MNAKEFRIGNLINYRIVDKFDERKEWLEVSEIDYDDLRIIEKKHLMNQDYQPIEITEEWLLKLNFEIIYKSNFTLRLDHKENYKFGAGWNLVNGHFHIRYIGEQFTHIKYVHQLQNLYFAITELELSLNTET